MKRNIPLGFSFLASLLISITAIAQEAPVPDQNPNYMVSRSKYMKMADSVNTWHSTTYQDTYNSIDYLEDRAEARMQRQAFRRELRLERARNGYGGYYNDYNYYPSYQNRYYNNYGYNRGYYNRRFGASLPIALTFGWYWR
jgi:hypothetical protein